jgi:hypothetical protein
VATLLKKLIRRMVNRCGFEILTRQRLHDYETRFLQADSARVQTGEELARTRTEYESRLANKVLELARAKNAYQDAQAQLVQTQKVLKAETAPAPIAQADAAAHPDAAAHVARALESQQSGDEAAALKHYYAALDLIHGYGPARQQLMYLSGVHWQQYMAMREASDLAGAKRHLVRAVELDPTSRPARAELDALLQAESRRDLTRQCFVYHDPVRGEQVYREAFLRALEYVAVAGITGEVLEFGVLGGFTARIIAETMRDLLIVKQLHLFDSFEGLPEYTSPVDAGSYDIAERKLWADRMRFPDSFVAELGEPIDQHIFSRLCDVISPERLFVYRGFFAETLQKPLGVKAALIHVDCDLYQSTREVLDWLLETDVLQDGSVLLFDDYNCFKASPHYGERRAFREFLDGQGRFTASAFFSYGFNGAAFFLHERPRAVAPPAGYYTPVFDFCGLRTDPAVLHNHDFLKDPRFIAAYSRGSQAQGEDPKHYWRAHVALWCAAQAARLPGDFVECGVWKGFLCSAIMSYLDWNKLDRKFFLFDTFCGIDEDQVTAEERERLHLEHYRLHYLPNYEDAVRNFAEFKNVNLVKGSVPQALREVEVGPVCFLSLDMNNVTPELAAAEYFWDRLVPGATVLLDDYGFVSYEEQKRGFDQFARARGVEILALPTGQGLLIKPGRG